MLTTSYHQDLTISPSLVLTEHDFGEADMETVSAPLISAVEVKEPMTCLALDFLSSLLCLSDVGSLKESLSKGILGREVRNCMYTWPVGTAFKVK